MVLLRYEGQRDMLYNQTFNLDQVSFAAEGIKDAQQTVSVLVFMMMCHKQIFVCVCVCMDVTPFFLVLLATVYLTIKMHQLIVGT